MKKSIILQKDKYAGFTLIELLVVVSLIGILATLIMANLNATRGRARDSQRKSDIRNIQTALRIYYNDEGQYPTSSSGRIVACGSGSTACDWGDTFSNTAQTYMSVMPIDPLPDRKYLYTYDAVNDEYTLETCLENDSDQACNGGNCTAAFATGPGTPDGCIYTVIP